ncbi:GntR family transcriptional regulator [Roseisalinus antarcticus]|uniref:HTH-type transcriptional regulator McbR n=1 Tax=Roseisalinus antarcticus TaxID=254357 RepID=A0A1Y5TNR6_9RHOB|nr:GntR family transcriptional regulator [Roseisalinus antarcticus]SLN68293.1 HTH-type transcriptional regulator McbR [Roseisalinus antarcticus]
MLAATLPDLADRAPLGEDVARHLASEIIRLRPPPGAKLVETELCDRHGVSRSPMREALRLLEFWSLAKRRPRYGVFVAPMSVQNLDDLTTCRIPLEARAAALVAEHPSHPQVAERLLSRLVAMAEAQETGDVEACFTANLAMMDSLHGANPNPVLARLLGEVNLSARRYRYLVYQHSPETLTMLLESNAALIAAIRSGDGDRAHAVTEEMVRNAWQSLRVRLPEYLRLSPDGSQAT